MCWASLETRSVSGWLDCFAPGSNGLHALVAYDCRYVLLNSAEQMHFSYEKWHE